MLSIRDSFCLNVNLDEGRLDFNGLLTLGQDLSSKLVPELVSNIIEKIQICLFDRYLGKLWNRSQTSPTPWSCPRCFSKYGFVRRGKRYRTMQSSFGRLRFSLHQVTCDDCGKTFVPILSLWKIPRRKRLTLEFEKKMASIVKDLSYKKSSDVIKLFVDSLISPRTIHNVVQKKGNQAVILERKWDEFRQLQIDSTNVNAFEHGKRITERGVPIHLAISIDGVTLHPKRNKVHKTLLELQVGSSPDRIKKLVRTKHIGQLVVDGHSGVEDDAASNPDNLTLQRCMWHLPRTLKHNLYLEHVPLEERKMWAWKLADILFSKELQIEEQLNQYRILQDQMDQLNYDLSTKYLEKAMPHVFAYFSLEQSLKSRTMSIVERQMREIKRRTKIGAVWSPSGVENLLRLKFIEELNPISYNLIWRTCSNTNINWSVVYASKSQNVN